MNFKILLISVFALVSISSVFAVTGLNVVLSSQNPDPVTPGNFVFLNVKVANSGDEDIKSATIELVENENFKIAQGSEKIKNLGAIPSYSTSNPAYDSDEVSGFVIAKFKVLVNENTPLGLNAVDFKVKTTREYNYEFDILVEDENPTLEINKFELTKLKPGESGTLKIELENLNSITLKDIKLSLDLDEVEDEILSMKSGSNQKRIAVLDSKATKIVEFELTSSPEASSVPYNLPVTIEFEDALGNTYTQEIIGSVLVYSKPQLAISIDSQETYSKGKGKVTLAIANPGTSTIKGTQVELISSEKYSILEGKSHYIGDLNPDDFQTIQSQIYVNSNEETDIKFKVTYLDSYNNENSEELTLPLTIYNEEELKSFGLASNSSQSGGGIGSVIVNLIVLIIVFYIGMRVGSKRTKKKLNK